MAKPPKAPEKPASPYMRFSKKIWDSVRSEHRDLHLWEVNKILGLMWRQLPDMEKQEFQDEYDVEKAEYDKQVCCNCYRKSWERFTTIILFQMGVYKNSPAYQTYMQAKARNAPVVEDPEPKGTKSGERRIDIQQAEDAAKAVAAAQRAEEDEKARQAEKAKAAPSGNSCEKKT